MTGQVSGAASRRDFLAIAGGAAVGSTAFLVPQAAKPVAAAEFAAANQGYRETIHVQTFYQLARF